MLCPCCSFLPYDVCCRPLHEQQRAASSALALMRSRFSAFALKKSTYIVQTYVEEERKTQDIFELEMSLQNTEWTRLEIIKVYSEAECDRVQFAAYCVRGGQEYVLKEDSAFRKEAKGWCYWGAASRSM